MSALIAVKLRCFRLISQSWIILTISLILFSFSSSLALGTERLCDTSFENCRNPLVALIQKENVEIDVAFWFMDDSSIANALINQINKGVKVRMLVDPRADEAHQANLSILQTFATMTPPAPIPKVPMRKRIASSILHWKMMLFAGQGVVEFSGANFSPIEFVPSKPYQVYTDEAIFSTDDMNIVNSFRTMYDRWWVDTVNYADYANTSGMTLTPSYAIYPIESEACAVVPNGCGMDFLPSSNTKDDYGQKTMAAIRAERTKLDIDMFRITNADITNTTIAAFGRGVPVRMIVDSSEYSNPSRVWVRYNVDRLFMAGIPIKITKHGGENHEKSLLFYGQGLTVWGSSNWSAGSFNYGQEHDYFNTRAVKPWFFDWFQNHFERRWNSPQEYRAFVPLGPGAPVYKNPPNGATVQSQSLTLSWDGGPWGQIYDIYLAAGATATPRLIASNVVTGNPDVPPNHALGTFKVSGLAPNTYRWQIVSKTMANLTNTGPIWSFTIAGNAPPSGATVSSICVPSGQTCGPATGPSTGGTPVTITGANFANGATVTFGVATASKIVVVNSTTITAVSPPYSNTGGSATVTVTNSAGDAGSLAGGFVYTANPPVVTPRINVVVPGYGSPSGGTSITIAGSNFISGATVTIGGSPATITNRSTVSIQATTPAGTAGPADVVITTPNGSTTLSAGFTYMDPPGPPSVTGISPTSGTFNGGTPIIINGTGFQYGAVVSFGGPPPPVGTGVEATRIAVANDPAVCAGAPSCIIATTPQFAVGPADVVVTNMDLATGIIDSGSGSSTLTGGYTFLVAPSISQVSPSSGTVSGGTQITVTGTNFQPGATVLIGGQQATLVSTSGTNSITVITPANTTAGTSPVTVVNPDTQTSNTWIYTYQ